MIKQIKRKLFAWRYENACKKAIELKLRTGMLHIVIPNHKGKFIVINKHSTRKIRKKYEGMSWSRIKKVASFIAN